MLLISCLGWVWSPNYMFNILSAVLFRYNKYKSHWRSPRFQSPYVLWKPWWAATQSICKMITHAFSCEHQSALGWQSPEVTCYKTRVCSGFWDRSCMKTPRWIKSPSPLCITCCHQSSLQMLVQKQQVTGGNGCLYHLPLLLRQCVIHFGGEGPAVSKQGLTGCDCYGWRTKLQVCKKISCRFNA